jgi:hypothetical protein
MRGRPVLAFLENALVDASSDRRAKTLATLFFVHRWRWLDQPLAEPSVAP